MKGKKMKLIITEPCRIDGKEYVPGNSLDVEDTVAMDVVSAGRGTIDPTKGAAAVAAAKDADKPAKA